MVTIEIVINSTRVMSISLTMSYQYCIAFEVMLLVSSVLSVSFRRSPYDAISSTALSLSLSPSLSLSFPQAH